MKQIMSHAALAIVCVLSAGISLADKPQSKDHRLYADASNRGGSSGVSRRQSHIEEYERSHIKRYYAEHRPKKHCPPGLAKKGNGCLPPGQAKKWHRGAPLPHDVVYHDLPYALLHELSHTREGEKLIRVGTDILLIHAGTRVVLDAIRDVTGEF